jgi:SAM-dependent methyltransferase
MTRTPEDFIANLVMGENGFLQAKEASAFSYPEEGHDHCQAVEESSFWFGHRNEAIRSVIEQFPPPADLPFLDVGGGNGFVGAMISTLGHRVVLIEPGESGARCARDERGIAEVVQASIVDLEVASGSVGAIGMFDVLEHIEADVDALVRLREMLVAGGKIYLTVPSHRLLWSSADVQAGHYRRYTRKQLVRVLEKAGFEVEFDSYFFWPLPVPMFLLRCLPERLRLRKGESRAQRVTREHDRSSGLVDKALGLERRRLGKGRSLGFGASTIAVAVKPGPR